MKIGERLVLSLLLVGLIISMNPRGSLAAGPGQKKDILSKEELALPLDGQLEVLKIKINKIKKILEPKRSQHKKEKNQIKERLAQPNITPEEQARLERELQALKSAFNKETQQQRAQLKACNKLKKEIMQKLKGPASTCGMP